MHHTLRRLAAATARFVLVAGVLAAVAGWWTPAAAHTEVLRASPAPGEEVSGAVERVELTFLDPILPGATIDVVDGLGDTVAGSGEAEISDDGRRAEVPLRPLRGPGEYVVEYTFTAADGDTQRETYEFAIRAGADDGGPGAGTVVAVAAAVAILLAGTVVSLVRRRRGAGTTTG